jgi:hypothetical protein
MTLAALLITRRGILTVRAIFPGLTQASPSTMIAAAFQREPSTRICTSCGH